VTPEAFSIANTVLELNLTFDEVTAMQELERVAAILKPSEIMLDWINEQQSDEGGMLLLEDIQIDCTVILLPTFEEEEEAEDYLNQIYEELFVNELTAWNEDESTWPQDRSIDTFLEWFDIEFHSIVYDCTETLHISHQKKETLQ
jgi:hypothetical protein